MFVRATSDQDVRDVPDKPVVENGPEVSFSTTITGTSASSSQFNQVSNNQERTQGRREMERTNRTSLTPNMRMGNNHANIRNVS